MSGFEISIIDSNVNSSPKVLESLIKLGKEYNKNFSDQIHFYKGDIQDQSLLDSIFKKSKSNSKPINAVIILPDLRLLENHFKIT